MASAQQAVKVAVQEQEKVLAEEVPEQAAEEQAAEPEQAEPQYQEKTRASPSQQHQARLPKPLTGDHGRHFRYLF
jgi:hypothetical protein